MEMWGDAEGAYSLKPSDSLSKSLFEITSSVHIPYNDSRWQKLFLHYEQLVHLHYLELTPQTSTTADEDVTVTACRQAAKNGSSTSNLAALCLHVGRMIRELQTNVGGYFTDDNNASDIDETVSSNPPNYSKRENKSTKRRISLIGKARVTCGALNLLRILSHETIVQASCSKRDDVSLGNNRQPELEYDTNYLLKRFFTYRSHGGVEGRYNNDQDAAMEIIASIMSLFTSVGLIIQQGNDSEILAIPEIYDVIVQTLSLLLVLLSTQVYQPMISSTELLNEGRESSNFFLDKLMICSQQQRNKAEHLRQQQVQSFGLEATDDNMVHNEPQHFVNACLHWLVVRPRPPRRSIAAYYSSLTKSIAQSMSNMVISKDGMYENYSIVMASAPHSQGNSSSLANSPSKVSLKPPSLGLVDTTSSTHRMTAISIGTDDALSLSSPGHVTGDVTLWDGPLNLLLHPIRSLLTLSSSFFLLPIRLVRMAFLLLGHRKYRAIAAGNNQHVNADVRVLHQLEAHHNKHSGWNKTNNTLWLSDSPISDLASAVMLVLSNNCRARDELNPFRAELASLTDNRWESEYTNNQTAQVDSLVPSQISEPLQRLSVNFELLFEAFRHIAHTEVGALSMYTLLLASPSFAQSVGARSDLDKLILPLLRSLYFSTTMAHSDSMVRQSSTQHSTPTQGSQPFRSQSQLYVILILLLIFSQDPSFGRDSFRRVRVSMKAVVWYKERHIKEASLGSMILLVLLRAISFNLNRLHDEFLLSNCCAALLNLSPHTLIQDYYVATRLISVTTSCFKRYATLLAENRGEPEIEGDLSTSLGLHGETCRTLLQLVRHSIRPKYLERNVQLVYALLLEQRQFQKMCQFNSLGDLSSISEVINNANAIIRDNSDGTTADQTLGILKAHISELKSHVIPDGLASDSDSVASDASDLGNLTYTYEEEADPEVFFVPYVWDVIICTVTTATMEWSRSKIQVFPLNHVEEEELHTQYNISFNDIVSDAEHNSIEFVKTDSNSYGNTPDVV